MTYQKVVKSHQQKFSPQYVTKDSVITSLSDYCNSIPSSQEPLQVWLHPQQKRNRLTEARALDLVYVHSNFKLLQKLQSLDYQETNVEWERWAVSDSDSSEEEQ